MIPQSVTTIGTFAFQYCNFNSIEIPGNVTGIGSNAFENCGSLTAVILKEGIKSINSYAFAGCKALTSITIPKSVTFIGNNAFDGTSLTSVTSLIDLPFVINGKTSNGRAFSFTSYENATLYVPKGTIDKYKATEGWKEFLHIEEAELSSISTSKMVNKTKTKSYTIDGKMLNKPQKGLNIIQYSDGTTQKVVVK